MGRSEAPCSKGSGAGVIGQKFGKLVVVAAAGSSKWKELLWECQCDCGQTTVTKGKLLRSGLTRSCGCLVNAPGHGVTHGGRYTRLYRTWRGMRSRCEKPADKDFCRYGAVGIKVCDEWSGSFAAFRAWAHANGYADDLLIDRIDPTLGYQPSNCRWLTPAESSRHTRAVKLSMDDARKIRTLAAGGESHTSIARRFGVSRSNVSQICEGRQWREASQW